MREGDFELAVIVDDCHETEYRDEETRQAWIAARKGKEFCLLLQNHGSGRALAVTTIDGLSIHNGELGSFSSGGYILEASSNALIIPGWRIDDETVAHFAFGSRAEGYATKIGQPQQNIGVIAAAFFHEKIEPEKQYSLRAVGPGPSLRMMESEAPPEPTTDNVAVGFGRQTKHRIKVCSFKRASQSPEKVIAIRYDTSRSLAKQGIGCPVPEGWLG